METYQSTYPDLVFDTHSLQSKPLESSHKDRLLDRIQDCTAKVAIIGMGYVGVPLATCVARIGFDVIGIDVNPERVFQLNSGESYINDVTNDELGPLVESGKFRAYETFGVLSDADIVVICVPTPLTRNREPDVSYIRRATEEIAKHLKPGQLITLESTTYPGTTEEVLLPILAEKGLVAGQDYFLAHSPERVDPGNARFNTRNTNKVVGGYTAACSEVAAAFYGKNILEIVSVSSPGCAEMVKVFENTFRAVNVALVNELALLCDKMNLNIWEVVEAAGTKPFGMMSFSPGPGVGGHCIPVDPFYLAWKAKEYNFQTRFIELAGEINSSMPQFVREKIIRGLGKNGKPLYGANILILGIAYKKDLGDWRHSPGLDLFHLLQQDETRISYCDPHVPSIEDQQGQKHIGLPLTKEVLGKADCVVIITSHTAFDYDFIVEHSALVVDTRNACAQVKASREKIVLL